MEKSFSSFFAEVNDGPPRPLFLSLALFLCPPPALASLAGCTRKGAWVSELADESLGALATAACGSLSSSSKLPQDSFICLRTLMSLHRTLQTPSLPGISLGTAP